MEYSLNENSFFITKKRFFVKFFQIRKKTLPLEVYSSKAHMDGNYLSDYKPFSVRGLKISLNFLVYQPTGKHKGGFS